MLNHADKNHYFQELDDCAPMTREEEEEAGRRLVTLRKRVADGDASAERALRKLEHAFIRANLRLVVKLAARYGRSVPRVDLIQEGNMGLMKAIQKFDPERGFRFCTYASWWVRQSMTRYHHRTARVVAVPSHTAQRASTLRRLSRKLRAELGREPSEAELAEEAELTPAKVRLAQGAVRPAVSLDTPYDEDGQPLGERIPDEAQGAHERVAAERRRADVEAALDTLTEREADILRRRFAIGRREGATLAEVGEEYDLSRERIRQLQARAMHRLRQPLKHHHA